MDSKKTTTMCITGQSDTNLNQSQNNRFNCNTVKNVLALQIPVKSTRFKLAIASQITDLNPKTAILIAKFSVALHYIDKQLHIRVEDNEYEKEKRKEKRKKKENSIEKKKNKEKHKKLNLDKTGKKKAVEKIE